MRDAVSVRMSQVWVKQEGEWKVLHEHFSTYEIALVQAVVSRYLQATADGDVDAALACLTDTYTRIGHSAGDPGDPMRWRAWPIAAPGERRGAFERQFSVPGRHYEFQIEFLHTDITGDAAVVVANETGMHRSGDSESSWEGARNLWYLVKTDGAWRISGSVHSIAE